MTASEMFGVPVKGMPASVRSRAKAINFGLIYGMSAFGLMHSTGLTLAESEDFVKAYFQQVSHAALAQFREDAALNDAEQ